MELISIHNIKAQHHGCVLTIGNFDGVLQGHQGGSTGQVSSAGAALEPF
ncbi:hypothetical protein O9929_02945 [Vibrio lentus]|nr:hypothetical protein [Vibrio lentus]